MGRSMTCTRGRKPAPVNASVWCGVCEARQPLMVIESENAWRDVLDDFIDEHYGHHGIFRFTSDV
jgi:hypothetical protein